MLRTLQIGSWVRKITTCCKINLYAPVISLACILIPIHQPIASQVDSAPHELFQPVSLPEKNISLPDHIVSYQPVIVDIDRLFSVSIGAAINLNLGQNASYVGIVEKTQYHPGGSYTVSGNLDSEPHGEFAIAVVGDVAAAKIRAPLQRRAFGLRYAGEGIHLITEIDGTLSWNCPGGRSISHPGRMDNPPEIAAETIVRAGCSPETVYDLIVVYTSAARSAMGGTNSILAQISLGIEKINEGFSNSEIPYRVRLVHCYEVGYNESGNSFDDHLDYVSSNTDVAASRTLYGADLVCMWVDDYSSSGPAGIGICYTGYASEGYSVADLTFSLWYNVMGHEIGHNLGCDHERIAGDDCHWYSYSYAWKIEGLYGFIWTLMASSPSSFINYYSNPDVYYAGKSLGSPIGQPDEAHNAQTIINTAPTVTSFRPSKYCVWVDFANTTSPWEGTYANPYMMITYALAAYVYGTNASEIPTIWIKASSSSETPIFNEPLIVKSCGGSAVIGD